MGGAFDASPRGAGADFGAEGFGEAAGEPDAAAEEGAAAVAANASVHAPGLGASDDVPSVVSAPPPAAPLSPPVPAEAEASALGSADMPPGPDPTPLEVSDEFDGADFGSGAAATDSGGDGAEAASCESSSAPEGSSAPAEAAPASGAIAGDGADEGVGDEFGDASFAEASPPPPEAAAPDEEKNPPAAQFTLGEEDDAEDDDFSGFASSSEPAAPPPAQEDDADDGFGDFAAPPAGTKDSFASAAAADDDFGGFSQSAPAAGGDFDDDFGDFDAGGDDDFDSFASAATPTFAPAPAPMPAPAPPPVSGYMVPAEAFEGGEENLRLACREAMLKAFPPSKEEETPLGLTVKPLLEYILEVPFCSTHLHPPSCIILAGALPLRCPTLASDDGALPRLFAPVRLQSSRPLVHPWSPCCTGERPQCRAPVRCKLVATGHESRDSLAGLNLRAGPPQGARFGSNARGRRRCWGRAVSTRTAGTVCGRIGPRREYHCWRWSAAVCSPTLEHWRDVGRALGGVQGGRACWEECRRVWCVRRLRRGGVWR